MSNNSATSTAASSRQRSPIHRHSQIPAFDPDDHDGTRDEDDDGAADDDEWTGNAFATRDHPVQLRALHRNVVRCKILVGLSALAAIGMNISRVVRAQKDVERDAALRGWSVGAMVIPCLVHVLLACSALPLPKISLGKKKRFISRIRISQCHLATALFTLATVDLLLLSIQTYQAIDIFDYIHPRPDRPEPDHSLLTIYGMKFVISLTFWFSAGLMRRGPKLWYHAPATELGFGVPASEQADERSTEEILNDPEGEPVPNVLDDGGCSCLGFVFVGYMSPLLSIVRHGCHISESDMPYQPQSNRSFAVLGDAPNDRWKAYHARLGLPSTEKKRTAAKIGRDDDGLRSEADVIYTRWTLIRTSWDGLWLGVLYSALLEMLDKLLLLAPAVLMYLFVSQFETGATKQDQRYALLLAILFLTSSVAQSLLRTYLAIRENYQQHQVVRVRIEVLLFDKLLRRPDHHLMIRSEKDIDERENGKGQQEILRLVGMDSRDISSLSAHIFFPVGNDLITLVVGVSFLYRLSGLATLGMLVGLLSYPAAGWVMKYTYRRDKEYAAAYDQRIRTVRAALTLLKTLRLNGWNQSISDRLAAFRTIELRAGYRAALGRVVLSSALTLFSECTIVLVLALFVFGVGGRALTASSAFAILAVFDHVRSTVGRMPDQVDRVLRASIAVDRLVQFLNSPSILRGRGSTSDISMRNATIGLIDNNASDRAEGSSFTLKGINAEIPLGSLTLICGPTASGKSLLLQALLGEASVLEGKVWAPKSRPSQCLGVQPGLSAGEEWTSWIVSGAVAYVPQRPYIFHSSIRGNITNGLALCQERFRTAVAACALRMQDFPDQEETEIGEGGFNISVGQAARISLARAVYSQAQVVYLDDPLASVDSRTGQLISEGFATGLFAGRTIVMTSDRPGLYQAFATQVITLGDGRMLHVKQIERPRRDLSIRASGGSTSPSMTPVDPAPSEPYRLRTARHLLAAEGRKLGAAKYSHLWTLLKSAGGSTYFAVLGVVFVTYRSAKLGQQVLLREWTASQDFVPSRHSQGSFLGIYTAIMVSVVILDALRLWLVFLRFVQRVPARVHNALVTGVFGTTLQTQESIPVGRILSRFLADMHAIDNELPHQLDTVANAGLAVGMIVATLLWSTPVFVFVVLLLAPALRIAYLALASLRSDTRRCSRIAGSPIVTIFNDVLNSVAVIRAYGTQSGYISTLMKQQTAFCRLGLVEYIAYVYFGIAIFLVFQPDLPASQVGLTLSFATIGSSHFFNMLTQLVGLGATLVAVERVTEYQELPPEEDLTKVTVQPASNWPARGHIRVRDLRVRYADDLPDVLYDINFDVKAGERIGIVGHTGHGKSTLALALFRAVPVRTGTISMDGVDIQEVSLQALRSGLSMIPQEGLLNDGTLRDALDITGDIPDAELYDALRQVKLIPPAVSSPATVSSSGTIYELGPEMHHPSSGDDPAPPISRNATNRFTSLSTPVAPGGSNFSAGERQLLCLARALLRPRAVMVFDEATSSVDVEVDRKIKEMIRDSFRGSTMLVIAHRLATIIDFDRVMVIEHGRLVEFDTPANLLVDKTSKFSALAAASGEEELVEMMSSRARGSPL